MKKIFVSLFISLCIGSLLVGCSDIPKEKVIRQALLGEPAKDQTGVALRPTLAWNQFLDEGVSNQTYDVYLSTDRDEVENQRQEALVAKDIEETFFKDDKKPLAYGKIYFWRVVSKTGGASSLSDVNSFKTIENPVRVTGLVVDKTVIDLSVEGSDVISGHIEPASSAEQMIRWEISDPTVAILSYQEVQGKVDKDTFDDTTAATNGNLDPNRNTQVVFTLNAKVTVLGISPGITQITATTIDGSYSERITVNVARSANPITSLKINSENLNIPLGSPPMSFTVTVYPTNAEKQSLIWSVSPPIRAFITADGLFTPRDKGQVIVQVETADGKVKSNVTVNITDPIKQVADINFGSFNVDRDTLVIVVPTSRKLNYTITPSDATNQRVIWESGAQDFMSVSQDGEITAIRDSNGRVNYVSVHIEDSSIIKDIAVRTVSTPIYINDIFFKNPQIVLTSRYNRKATIVYSITPLNPTDRSLNWTPRDPSLLSVTDGVVTFIGAQPQAAPTQITVLTANGTRKDIPVQILAQEPTRRDIDILPNDQKHEFDYDGHKYYIINSNMTWANAANFARTIGSTTGEYVHLVHIDTQQEQAAIETALNTALTRPNAPLRPNFSGNSPQYQGLECFWTGATDMDSEGTWIWNGDNETDVRFKSFFPLGKVATSGGGISWTNTSRQSYSNWGTDNNGTMLLEPNNGGTLLGDEDSMGILLDLSIYGKKYQWTDVSSSESFPFIIEIE